MIVNVYRLVEQARIVMRFEISLYKQNLAMGGEESADWPAEPSAPISNFITLRSQRTCRPTRW